MYREIEKHYSDWILLAILLGVIFVLISRIYNPGKFKAFLYLPLRGGNETKEEFDPLGWRTPFDISMVINVFLSIALSILLINYSSSTLDLYSGAWRDYLRLFLIISAFFLVKSLLQLAIAWAFDKVGEIALSQNIELSYLAWLALMILPVNVIVAFVSSNKEFNFWLLLIISLAGWFQAFFRSSLQLWKLAAPSYYKIFYLCSLEIIPFIFLIKWIQVL